MDTAIKRLLIALLLVANAAYGQVTTNPAVTGVPAPQSAVAITGGTISGPTILDAVVAKGTWTTSGTWTLPAVTAGGLITATTGGISVPVSATGTVYSNVYTPTLTAVTNVAASTPQNAIYIRIGNVVLVSGQMQVDPTIAGLTDVGVSLPVASNLADAYDLSGVGSASTDVANIRADSTNDRATVSWTAINTADQTVTYTFFYSVK